MIILIILLIVGAVAGELNQAIFCVGLVITGMCGVRNNECYDIEQIMCVVFFSGYLWVFSLVGLILYLVDGNEEATALIAMFGGVVFYAFSCYFSKQLYDELRLNYQPPSPEQMPQGMFGGGGPFGRMMGNRQPPQNQYQQPIANNQGYQQRGYDQRPVNPQQGRGRGNIPPYQQSSANQSSGKFQAFQGAAHTLND